MDMTANDLLDDAVFDHITAVFAAPVLLDAALTLIMQRTCSLLDVEQTAFFVRESAGLRLMASNAPLPAPTGPITDPIVGWVAQHTQPLAVLDPGADPRFGQLPGWIGPLPRGVVPGVAAVAVRTSAGVAGVLVVIDLLPTADVQADQRRSTLAALKALVPFLQVMADLVALALENRAIVRVQERRSQFIRLLHLIATMPTTEVSDHLVQTITSQFCQITHAEAAGLLVHSPATDELVALGISTPSSGERPADGGRDHLPLATSGPLLDVFRSGVPAIIHGGPALDGLVLLHMTAIQSLLIVPLRVEQIIQGLVVVVSTRPTLFSEDDLHFVSFISVRLSYVLRQQTLAAELDRLEQQRIQQDARDTVINLVAHDLKNMLMTIGGSGHLALRKAARGDVAYSQRALRLIVTKTAQATQLINDMVDVNNVEQGRFRVFMTPVDLTMLVREEVEAAQVLSTRHTLRGDLPAMPVTIIADGPRLRQVMSNLLTNAIRYAPDGGTIATTVALITAPADGEPGGRTAGPPAVQITVSDPGIGISPADLPHIFDRFYRGQGESVAGGTGLGLYIVAEIVTQHGGSVWAESPPGGGTRVHVTMPLRRDAAAPAAG